MKKINILVIFLLLLNSYKFRAQTYFHPTVGIAGEFVGSCQVASCGGTYYDNGGIGGSTTTSGAVGNYADNIGFAGPPAQQSGIYRIFCPNAVGQCLRATFTQFSIEGGAGCPFDIFRVTNGSTQNSPLIWSGCGTGAIGPFTGTANGCLGFRFFSDNVVNRAGWAVNFSCVACAGGPNGTDNNDCTNATLICNSIAVPGNSTGPGILAEACGGGGCPAGGENYSNWYSVTFTSSGTFSFTIVPATASDDYDYAVYGPNVNCSALGPAIRCSDSYLSGNTGLAASSVDFTESVTGDKFTAIMNVLAGQTYYIMIDEWTPTGTGYTLNLGGTAGISCVPLPVELVSFKATYNQKSKSVNLDWSTATERNNDYFAVERSVNGTVFEEIAIVDGSNTTTQQHYYSSIDKNPVPGEVNYYRLRQVDFDGRIKYSDIEALVINDPESQFKVYPNPSNENAEILLITASESDYHLKIYDYTGKTILSHHFKSALGKNIIPLNLLGFNEGFYFVTLEGDGDMLKTSFVKQ